jgi:hypothetical protein
MYGVRLSSKLKVLRVLHPPTHYAVIYICYNKHIPSTSPYWGGFASATWGRGYAREFNG